MTSTAVSLRSALSTQVGLAEPISTSWRGCTTLARTPSLRIGNRSLVPAFRSSSVASRSWFSQRATFMGGRHQRWSTCGIRPARPTPANLVATEDSDGRRLIDARRDSGDHDDVPPPASPPSSSPSVSRPGAHVLRSRQAYGATLSELVEAGMLEPGERLEWNRPQSGVTFRAAVTEDGQVVLEDGRRFGSPSSAGTAAANLRALNGWVTWRVPRLGGRTLDEIRAEYLARSSTTESPSP